MQQIMYQQTPDVVLNYPENLEAVNTSWWTGWAPLWVTSGPVWNCQGNIASYLALRPVVSSSGSGGSSTGTLIAVAVVVVIVIAAIIFFVSRRRRQRVDVEV